MVYTLNNLGNVYIFLEKYDDAIKFCLEAKNYAVKLGALRPQNDVNEVLATIYEKKKEFNLAAKYLREYIILNDSIFSVEKSKAIANLESKYILDKKEKEFAILQRDNELLEKNNRLNSLEIESQARKMQIIAKQAEAEKLRSLAQMESDKRKADSLQNLAQKAQLESEYLILSGKKMLAEKKARELELQQVQETEKQERNIIYILIAVSGIMTLFLISYVRKNKLIRAKNKELYEKNNEITSQKVIIQKQSDELQQSVEELQQQQEELLVLNENLASQKTTLQNTFEKLNFTSQKLNASIRYASDVQKAVLPEMSEAENFFSDYFILFRPMDLVSGDFYWFSIPEEHKCIFALADCTGHGVPGAFMSMLGATLLHETVNIKKIHDNPARILKNINSALTKILRQKQKKNRDGMDIAVCVFEKKNEVTEVVFAGAKASVFYLSDNIAEEIKGDNKHLGGGEENDKEFTNKHISAKRNDTFYLFTDGYKDQNNPERQRIGKKVFFSELLTCSEKELSEQKAYLEKVLDEFQNGTEQRDDITVIGLKL